ncbi:MAG: hypothetical protein FJ042_05340 [Candidatus Cloacimonetes bacterium]|nr:hypothetical protein [Candidatus Cloacimonadota bacterium]
MNAQQILEYIKQHCTADDWTITINEKDSHETRFAQNSITQHIAGSNIEVALQVSFGDKTGVGNINQTDAESIKNLIETAETMAKLNQPDPEFMPSCPAADLPQVLNRSEATLQLAPQEMVELVRQSIANGEKHPAQVSGMTEKHRYYSILCTSNGFYGECESTEFGHSMTMKKDAVETKVAYSGKDYARFDLNQWLDQLNSQFNSLSAPHVFEPERIAVILRPAAVQEFIGYMGWMMSRRYADEGITPYTDKLGTDFFGSNFSMVSTLKDDELYASPYFHGGIPSVEFDWVKRGSLFTLPTDRFWAKKTGSSPSTSYNLFIPGDGVSEEEMMKKAGRGIIINNFWYIRTVDMKSGEFTGMTRDGVLYFEDGIIRHAINNLRWNEIPHEATRRILASGVPILTSPDTKVPAMLIADFNFVDKTDF